MAGIGFGGIMIWWLLKKNPNKAHEMIATSHEYLKSLPIDQNVSNITAINNLTLTSTARNDNPLSQISANNNITLTAAKNINNVSTVATNDSDLLNFIMFSSNN